MDFLIIDPDRDFREQTCRLIDRNGHYAEAAGSGEMGLVRLKEEKFDAVLLDLNLDAENGLDILEQIIQRQPGLPVIIFTAQASVKNAVEAMRRGAFDFLEKPFTREHFLLLLARLQGRRGQPLNQNGKHLETEVKDKQAHAPEPLLDFTTPRMREVMHVLLRAAKTPASILILGESGTGKSVAARCVHQQSHLTNQPFVTVSCPSLSAELLESTLFGHVKGAFTGAVKDHWGKVKFAAGGTLFLDEIGDLPMTIQPKLLRLLQEQEYERVGENVTHHAEVRIIAATSRDLKKRIVEGTFREDLYFRINVITVEMPPLRERYEDLLHCAGHYLTHFLNGGGRRLDGFSAEAMARIKDYAWPGNLRELRNVVEHAVIMARNGRIGLEDLPAELRDQTLPGADLDADSARAGSVISLEKLDELHTRKVVKQASNLGVAAEILGIHPATLYRKRKQFGMS